MEPNQKNRKKKQLPFRINVLFFIVFLLFSVLVLRLGVLQIVHGEEYQRSLNRTVNNTVNTPVPRGKIYDSDYTLLVDNEPLYAITYTRDKNTSNNEMLDIAQTLAGLIDKSDEKVTERDEKDFGSLQTLNWQEKKSLLRWRKGSLKTMSCINYSLNGLQKKI
ncbi:hypothetical protein [Litoribacterium kuwaitense]|uniref:hypothetical protein n=1 Tax=Litoribacterium kuwaitense TaxID=1398745 RepID=UPI0028ACC8AC|nr:hypothetical protein [Litoribacterium kuwaitense]